MVFKTHVALFFKTNKWWFFKTHVALFFNTNKWWFSKLMLSYFLTLISGGFCSKVVSSQITFIGAINGSLEFLISVSGKNINFLFEKMPYHSVHRHHHHHHHIVRIGSGHTFTCRAGQTGQLSRQFDTVL